MYFDFGWHHAYLFLFTFIFLIFYYIFDKKRSIKDRHVVVTAGSSGFGLWVAIHCAKLGAHVTIIGRNMHKLKSAVEKIKSFRINENQMILYRSIDLSADFDAIENLVSTFEQEIGPIFMLIICAVRPQRVGQVAELPIDPIFNAVYYPAKSVFDKIYGRGNGIITIAASRTTVDSMGPAAEFALRGLTESIKPNLWNFLVFTNLQLVDDIAVPNDGLVYGRWDRTWINYFDSMAFKIVDESVTGRFNFNHLFEGILRIIGKIIYYLVVYAYRLLKWWYQSKCPAEAETLRTEPQANANNLNADESAEVSDPPTAAASNAKATSSDPATNSENPTAASTLESNNAVGLSASPALLQNESPSRVNKANQANAEPKPNQTDKSETSPLNSGSSTKDTCTKRKSVAFSIDFTNSSSSTSTTNTPDTSEAGSLPKQKKKPTISSIPVVAIKTEPMINTNKPVPESNPFEITSKKVKANFESSDVKSTVQTSDETFILGSKIDTPAQLNIENVFGTSGAKKLDSNIGAANDGKDATKPTDLFKTPSHNAFVLGTTTENLADRNKKGFAFTFDSSNVLNSGSESKPFVFEAKSTKTFADDPADTKTSQEGKENKGESRKIISIARQNSKK